MTSPSTAIPVLLTPATIAQRWGVSTDAVLVRIRSGALRAIVVGGGTRRPRYRIRPRDLAEYEAAREVQRPTRTTRRARAETPPGFVRYFGHGGPAQ